jgi:acetyl-CoA acyltransferase
MNSAVIVDVVRTPGGKRDGKLKDWHPASLAAHTLKALAKRNPIDVETIDDVIMGCVMQVGPQTLNVARNAVLTAGWPETVPGTTVDRQCGSGQQAIHFAAQGVMAGVYDAVVAGGVEVMSKVPLGASIIKGMDFPFPPAMFERYEETGLPPQGIGAEMIADQWGLSRGEIDAFAAASQQRAERATDEGRFEREIVPVPVTTEDGEESMTTDEGIRPGTTAEKLGALKPAFKEDGKITAGNSSQITDGAAAMLIMNEEKARALGLRPRARFHTFALAGADPVTMLTGPIPATAKLFERSGLSVGDIDLFEVNEAFAPVVLAWQKETGADMNRVNVNGGAIALGHPLGASGVRIMATLLSELERTEGRYGLQVICEGGGLANAAIIERI